MTSKPSRDKRTFTSRQDPSGTGPSRGDAFDRTLKVSHNRATPQQTNAAADRDLPRRRLPVVDRPANRSRRGGGG